jgi:hypothetical protein
MSRRAAALRGAVLGLWLLSGLPPLLAPPARQAVPPCCRVDGAHQCSMRVRHGGGRSAAALTARCDAGASEKATGARFTALHPTLPRVSAQRDADGKVLPLPQEDARAAVILARASRAPPRRLV